MMFFVLFLITQIPFNFGILWTDPTLGLIPSSWYGQITVSYPTRNLEVEGFQTPYTKDISLFYSGSYNAEFDLFSIKFKKKVYNVTKPITVLNSERGYGDYASAGFIFKQNYRQFSFSIIADYMNDGFKKYSTVNPCFSYGKLSAYYYRFIQDDERYFRLFYIGYDGKWKISGIYGESVGEGRAFFHGFSMGKDYGKTSFSLTGEFMSDRNYFGKAMLTYRLFNLALTKPFGLSKVFPEFRISYKPGFWSVSLNGITVDSSYRIYMVSGVDTDSWKILFGYGRIYVDSGYKNFVTGNIKLDIPWQNWLFTITGKLYSEQDVLLDSVKMRTVLTYTRIFKEENYLKISGIVDYANGLFFSLKTELMLFKSVFLRVEEVNITNQRYPFGFPENNKRLYRISVAAILTD